MADAEPKTEKITVGILSTVLAALDKAMDTAKEMDLYILEYSAAKQSVLLGAIPEQQDVQILPEFFTSRLELHRQLKV